MDAQKIRRCKLRVSTVDAVRRMGVVTSMLPESKCELMTSLHATLDSSILSVLAAFVGAALPSSHLRWILYRLQAVHTWLAETKTACIGP